MKRNRQKEIVQILEREKVVIAQDLAERFDVSLATIRRDLDQLEKQRILRKTYGGAELRDSINSLMPSLSIRHNKAPVAKAAIALAALQYIPNGATIALDSGSTISELCRHLSSKNNLTIICSDTHNANLTLSSGNRVYMMGGFLTPDGTSDGTYAREFLSNVGSLDLFISSTDGADPEDGITTNELGINELKRRYLKKANTTIMMIDHSKFKHKGFYKMCSFSDIDIVITDNKTPADIIESIKRQGVQVVVADF